MKYIFPLLIVLTLISNSVFAQEKIDEPLKQIDILTGEWTIDLRPSPESDGYFHTFNIELVEENAFSGTFYGSKLENAFLNKNWDKVYFAFTTRDQSNEYFHSGYLLNGELYGITYCPNRKLTTPWTGLKKE
ncbi:MAG: hypothetical protein WBM53_00400 [Maribacter sp.]